MDKHDYKMSKAQEKLYRYAAEHGYDMAKFSDFFSAVGVLRAGV